MIKASHIILIIFASLIIVGSFLVQFIKAHAQTVEESCAPFDTIINPQPGVWTLLTVFNSGTTVMKDLSYDSCMCRARNSVDGRTVKVDGVEMTVRTAWCETKAASQRQDTETSPQTLAMHTIAFWRPVLLTNMYAITFWRPVVVTGTADTQQRGH